MGLMSVERLAIAIGEMRLAVRSVHVDIRANTRVIKTLHSWMDTHAAMKRQANEQVAAEDFDDEEVDYRERRELKRSRQAGEADPSFLGEPLTRNAAEPARNTRAKMQKLDAARDEPVVQPRLSVPAAEMARPPPNNSVNAAHFVDGQQNAADSPDTQTLSLTARNQSHLPVSHLLWP